jgi:intracellular sulfur oxidation DsrE/DsrF family protein
MASKDPLMNKIMFMLLMAAFTITASAQKQPYNIVFDVTSSDTAVHARVIRWINLIMDADPAAKIEVVFYGKSVPMVTQERSTVAAGIQSILADKKATFTVCEAAMKANGFVKSNLLPGINTVPDGLYELVKKQAEGYGYIKVTNQ